MSLSPVTWSWPKGVLAGAVVGVALSAQRAFEHAH
jgi:hypothetical protein